MIAVAELLKAGIGWRAAAAARAGSFGENELRRCLDRQHAQQHRVDQAEDGGVGADPQREGQDGDGGESRIVAQHARGIAQVLQQVFDGGPAPSLARDLPPEGGAAELQVRRAVRVGGGRAAFDRGSRLHVHVETHLLFEIAVDSPAVPQEREPPPEFAKRRSKPAHHRLHS